MTDSFIKTPLKGVDEIYEWWHGVFNNKRFIIIVWAVNYNPNTNRENLFKNTHNVTCRIESKYGIFEQIINVTPEFKANFTGNDFIKNCLKETEKAMINLSKK